MTVAIYTDASVGPNGVGAWAAVVLIDGSQHVEAAGLLRGRFIGSTEAEGAAMANALWYAKRQGLVETGSTVTIRSDCADFVRRIDNALAGLPPPKKSHPKTAEAVAYVTNAAATLGLALAVEWVKGHQNLASFDPHAIWNIRCDQLCNAARRKRTPPPFKSLRTMVDQQQEGRRKKLARAAAAKEAQAHVHTEPGAVCPGP